MKPPSRRGWCRLTRRGPTAQHLRGAKPEALEPILESLVAVGLAQETPTATGGRAWRALR